MPFQGWASLCLPAPDLDSSKRFYLACGLTLVSEVPGKRVLLASGNFRLALMSFLDHPLVNIRGGDVESSHQSVLAACPGSDGIVQSYTREEFDADADGVCWATHDPGGHAVLFDTNELEKGPEYVEARSKEILEAAADELERMGVREPVVSKLREEVLPLLSSPP